MERPSLRTFALRGASLAAMGIAASLISSAALAQEAASESQLDEVIITGSRIQRTGFTTPTPTTAVTTEDLQLKGDRSAVSIFADLPQVRPNRSVTGSTNVGGAQVDLRGLGSSRTLILIDGRRVASTTPSGGVDINVLPSGLFERVEIVTGGASAAYGSDAVSGVVNIFLDGDFEGLKGDVQYGQTQRNDDQERSGSITFGRSFADGKGHFLAAGELYKTNGALDQGTRSWGDDSWALMANPAYAAGNGQPRQLILPNSRLSQITDGGVIVTAGPLRNIQFLEGGAQAPYRLGTNVGTVFMTGGDGANLAYHANLSPELSRQSAFARLTYEVAENVTGFIDGLYARSTQRYDVIPNYNQGDLRITRDNAFLPANLRAIMLANNLQFVNMGRTNLELGYNLAYGENTTKRIAGGLNGRLGSSWTWDAFYQYSRNRYYSTVGNNRNNARWLQSVDSVISPTTGQPICRSTLTNPNDGCVPVNLFGVNSISAEARGYVIGTSTSDQVQTQHDVAFNVQGEPFDLWAGPVSIAVGAEYRREAVNGTSDPLSQAAGWRAANPQPLSGKYNVKEGYIETVVPLLKDAPLAELLEFNGAVRLTDYSTSGSVTTWKGGINYTPFSELRFRGTLSHDIRAPNINELFAGRNQNINAVTDRNTNLTVQALLLTGGNPDLDPEIADTLTAGVVYEPAWAPGLRTSLDYYNIEIDGSIGTLAAQTIIDRCFAGESSLCSAITRNPTTGVITQVFASFFNSQKLKTSGFDFEAAYTFPVERVFGGADGDLSLHLLSTYVDKLITINSNIATDTSGQLVGGVPHWRVNLTATYRNGPLTVSSLVRYIQGGRYNNTWEEGVDVNDNSLPSRTYLNVSAQYRINDHFQVFGRINNVFDTNPPIAPNSLNIPYTATSTYFDNLGRTFALGLRFNY